MVYKNEQWNSRKPCDVLNSEVKPKPMGDDTEELLPS